MKNPRKIFWHKIIKLWATKKTGKERKNDLMKAAKMISLVTKKDVTKWEVKSVRNFIYE